MLHYDVVVIGSGPAGENGAIAGRLPAARRWPLVEKEAVPGGASANTGTIPSKALRETALAIQQARSRDAHGIELRGLRHRDGAGAHGPPRARHRRASTRASATP